MTYYNNKSEEKLGIMVIRRDNEDIESLIRRFKKKVNNSGILKEVKKNSFYLKPGQKKRRKIKENEVRRKKDELKMKRRRGNEKYQGDK